MRYEFKDPHDTLLHVASKLGFERRGGALVGELGELTIRARFERPVIRDGESGLEIIVTGSVLPLRVMITSLSFEGPIAPRTLGDPAFDAVFRVAGDVAEVYASLGAALRAELLALAVGTVRVTLIDRRLTYRDPRFKARDGGLLELAVRGVMRVARALANADELDSSLSLAWIAEKDPSSGVRHGALRALFETAPSSSSAESSLEKALASDDLYARIIAAPHAGARGVDALMRILRDEHAGTARPEALRALEGTRDPNVALEDLAIELLADKADDVRIAAAEMLSLIGSVRAVEPLLSVASALLTSRELQRAALRAARAIQDKSGGERGTLSVSDGESGAGAVSFAIGGELGLPED